MMGWCNPSARAATQPESSQAGSRSIEPDEGLNSARLAGYCNDRTCGGATVRIADRAGAVGTCKRQQVTA
jgi:hypothetical protein